MTRKQKKQEWKKMKRTLQAQGAKPDQIKDFYENSYLQERGDTPERSRKNIKRRLEGKSQKKNLSLTLAAVLFYNNF